MSEDPDERVSSKLRRSLAVVSLLQQPPAAPRRPPVQRSAASEMRTEASGVPMRTSLAWSQSVAYSLCTFAAAGPLGPCSVS